MTDAEIIDGVIEREGGFTDDPADSGGATHFGITATALGAWRMLGRKATRAEVAAMSRAEAEAIYRARYVEPFADITDDALRVQLIDFGVLSGLLAAKKALQRAVNVDEDGILGLQTFDALAALPDVVVRRLLVAARCRVLSDLAEQRPKDRKWIRGWIKRAVAFF